MTTDYTHRSQGSTTSQSHPEVYERLGELPLSIWEICHLRTKQTIILIRKVTWQEDH